jgi:putative ABC transport system permease protein
MWARAPVRLIHFPMTLLAVMGTGIVLGVVASSPPLFLSSVGTSAFRAQIAQTSVGFAGLTVTEEGPATADRIAYRQRLLSDALEPVPGIGSEQFTLIGSGASVSAPGTSAPPVPVIQLTRTGFTSHIRAMSTAPGRADGIWLADTTARDLGVRAGDRVRVDVANSATWVHVAGIYQDLHHAALSPYWLPLYHHIWRFAKGDIVPLPSFALAPLPLLLKIEKPTADTGESTWQFPAATGITYATAQRLSRGLLGVQNRLADPRSTLGSGFSSVSTGLPALVGRATSVRTALSGSIGPLTTAGLVVSLLTVGLAGVFGFTRRRTEFGLYRARGLGAARAGTRAAIESLVPLMLGAAAGWVVAVGLSAALGAPGSTTHRAVATAAAWGAVAWACGVIVIGGVVGVAFAMEPDRNRTGRSGVIRRTAHRIPWEVPVLVLALAALWEIRGAGTQHPAGVHVDRLIGMFPVLFIAGLAGLAVRGLRRLLARRRSSRPGNSVALYLALRRASSGSAAAAWLITSSAIAIGMLVYGGVLATSAQSAASAKAHLAVGADVAVDVSSGTRVPVGAGLSATVVQRLPALTVGPGGEQVDVLGVDPGTFARGASWESRFAHQPLATLLAGLPSSSGPVPVVVVGGGLRPSPHLQAQGFSIPLRVTGSARMFPGMSAGRTLLVASSSALSRAMVAAGLTIDQAGALSQIWAHGSASTVLARLRAAGVPLSSTAITGGRLSVVHTAATAERTSTLQAISWTLGYVRALGLLTALLAVFAAILYLQARQRARQVSFAIASRMGLEPGVYRASLSLELAAMTGLAFVLGAALAIVAARLVIDPLDPLSALPPPPTVRIPLGLLGAIVLSLVSVAVLGAWLVQRRAGRSNVAEVMRLAS